MKVFEGIVVSNKMTETVIVEVVRRSPHKLYRKLMKKSKKYKVDTGGQQLNIGDAVKITETRPISKDKYFKISEIIKEDKKKKV